MNYLLLNYLIGKFSYAFINFYSNIVLFDKTVLIWERKCRNKNGHCLFCKFHNVVSNSNFEFTKKPNGSLIRSPLRTRTVSFPTVADLLQHFSPFVPTPYSEHFHIGTTNLNLEEEWETRTKISKSLFASGEFLLLRRMFSHTLKKF